MPRLRSSPRIIDVAHIGSDGLAVDLQADEAERAALAERNGLPRIGSLEAHFRLEPEGREGIHLTGHVEADVTQTCVVTLDPFDTRIRQPVDLHYLPEEEAERLNGGSHEASRNEDPAADDDPPEIIRGGRIDLGALMGEFLSLSLDPYPRKPDAVFVPPADPEDGEATVSPFAILGRMKPDRNG